MLNLGLYTNLAKFGIAPDASDDFFSLNEPSHDFILCRNINGEATAIYGNQVWDFNPYRTAASKVPVFNLNLEKFVEGITYATSLTNEIKWLLFCCIYKPNDRSNLGRLSVKTLYSYFLVIKNIALFASLLSKNEFIKDNLSIKTILTNSNYMKSLYRYAQDETSENGISVKNLNAVISRFAELGKDKIGYSVEYHYVDDERSENQHPVIPAQIYLYFINQITHQVDLFDKHMGQIEAFLSRFSDPAFGSTHNTQKTMGIGIKELRPTMREAIVAYGLQEVMEGVTTKHHLSSKLRQIQFTLKCCIHLYTGMRDQEVLRLPFDCVLDHVLSDKQKDSNGKVVVPAKIIKLISTTTKYAGYKKDDSWYAPKEALVAIKVLQNILKGLCAVDGLIAGDCPLFLNVSILSQSDFEVGITEFKKSKLKQPDWLLNTKITENDFALLKASDPERQFEDEPEFAIGHPWPLTSHQFRRSLAFYASNVGFVSLPTLSRQYKHLAKEITRYYGRNFENVKTIFGHYDEKSGTFILPKTHVIFECHAAVPTSTVHRLLDDLMDSDTTLFGKSGSYMQKQKERLFNGDVQIKEFRAETEKKVAAGEIAYNQTLLGGCTNVDGCDCRILGEFTDCLGSECAVIKKENVEKQIVEIEAAMKNYAKNSGEYQVLEVELKSLLKFKEYRIDARETV